MALPQYVVARHGVYWIFPSATERNAYVATRAEISKIAWQQSDDTLWLLKEAPSTWVSISVSAPAGSRYEHTQASAITTWVVNHNLNRNVQAEVYTTGGALIIAEIITITSNQIEVRFDTAQAGYCVVT